MPSFNVVLPYTPEGEQAAQAIAEVVQKLGGQITPVEDPEAAAGARQNAMGARGNRPSNLQAPVPVGPPPGMPPGPPM